MKGLRLILLFVRLGLATLGLMSDGSYARSIKLALSFPPSVGGSQEVAARFALEMNRGAARGLLLWVGRASGQQMDPSSEGGGGQEAQQADANALTPSPSLGLECEGDESRARWRGASLRPSLPGLCC